MGSEAYWLTSRVNDLPGFVIASGIELIAGATIGAAETFTLNVCETVCVGASSSDTMTVIGVEPIACDAAGVQVNSPLELMLAPEGEPVLKLYVKPSGGLLGSEAYWLRLNSSNWPMVALWSGIVLRVAGCPETPSVKVSDAEALGDWLSVTVTVIE